MRETIAGTWLMQIIIVFMLVFVGFLALAINYTKVFKIKNETLTIIEKYEGVKDESLKIINNYLKANNYETMYKCDASVNEYGMPSLDNTELEKVDSNKKYYYCIGKESTRSPHLANRSKYHIKLFLRFNLPILGDLITFTINGNSININNPRDNLEDMRI